MTHYVIYAILAAIGALFVFMVVRTICTRSPKTTSASVNHDIEADEIARTLSKAIQIPTVTPTEDNDGSPFLDYHAFLKNSFPEIFKKASVTVVNKYSLVIRIDGSDSELLPCCILAHQDVVPADPTNWETDPFGGEIKDGYVYGRGSLDMKGQMICSLYGLELLLREGKEPKRTVYYCFGHDEEKTGVCGALKIVEYLQSLNIKFDFILDEGGIILDGKILNIKEKVALIGICEKGYADFILTAEKRGGHASAPDRTSSVDMLADAIHDLKRTPMKSKWTPPVKELFKNLAPHMGPIYKFVFVNRDILGFILKPILSLINPRIAGLFRTTFAFTQLQGSDAPNVIPYKSTAIVNTRINVGETVETTRKHIQDVVGKKIKVEILGNGFNPTPISKTKGSEIFGTLTSAISDLFGYVTAPYPFIASTDAKHYYPLSENIYRFSPFELTKEAQAGIHGQNECCEIESLAKATSFFKELFIRSCY